MISCTKSIVFPIFRCIRKESKVLLKLDRIGLRWCNEDDILKGKGLYTCGNANCNIKNDLNPYEVNMAYVEEGENKNALVKNYLCKECGKKLNKMYKYLKRKRKRGKINKKLNKIK